MKLASFLARILSLHGSHKRAETHRARYKATHDQLRKKLGMPPIRWTR
jgi:hypothetical protein